jgi:hypothetical protein
VTAEVIYLCARDGREEGSWQLHSSAPVGRWFGGGLIQVALHATGSRGFVDSAKTVLNVPEPCFKIVVCFFCETIIKKLVTFLYT